MAVEEIEPMAQPYQAEHPVEPATLEQTYHLRRFVAAAGTVLGCAAASGAAAGAYAAFTPTAIEVGPHDATVSLTHDHTQTIDLGPLGLLNKPTWMSGLNPIGFRVTIKGIPETPGQTPLQSITPIINEYREAMGDARGIVNAARHEFFTRVWHDGADGAVGGALLFSPLLLWRRKRREEMVKAAQAADCVISESDIPERDKEILRTTSRQTTRLEHQRRRRRNTALFGLAACATAACSGSVGHPQNAPHVEADPALEGSPLQGFQTHGRLLQLGVDVAAPAINSELDDISESFDKGRRNLEQAFDEKFKNNPLDHKNYTYIYAVSDEHCDIGNYRVEGAAVKLFKPKIVINSGDLTNSGLVEEGGLCVAPEADNVKPKGVKEVFAAGNHDSPITEQQAQKAGMIVLHMNKPVTIDGISILGEDDVDESVFGTPMHLRGSETVQDETDALTKAACKFRPDILVVHEPEMATPAVQEGCTSISISGHLHHLHLAKLLNAATGSYQFINGTTGGAKPDSITFGKLQADSVSAVFRIDNRTHRPVGYWIVTEYTDNTVNISDLYDLPGLDNSDTQLAAGK